MASSCAHVGRQMHKTGKLLHRGVRDLLPRRYVGLGSGICQQSAAAVSGSTEEVVIPRKKAWNKEAVLQALASTVSRDPTAQSYILQDDPYLLPRTSSEFRLFYFSQESGKSAARYFITTYPNLFQKDFAEPHIPCLMPETLELQIEEVSEAALIERIQLRRVKAAIDMYDQLQQTGTALSLDLTNDLLDLICVYGDQDPEQNGEIEQRTEDTEEVQEDVRKTSRFPKRPSELQRTKWKENNNAERIFNLMPERTRRSYGALIRGMVKHGAYQKAFDTYTDLLNNRLTADVHIFNALIAAAPEVRDKYSDKWELVLDLLKQMAEQKVKPNLLTFNTVLKVLGHCGLLARAQAFSVISEMKALGIAPSLATYAHILGIFCKSGNYLERNKDTLKDVLNEISGKGFTPQDPDDVLFFKAAMKVCLITRDIEQAYSVNNLLGVGENWKLLGDPLHRNIYYGQFFSLLCMMEHIDVVLKWYRELVPSLYFPNSQGLYGLLQLLDTDNRLDLIPQIWKDIKWLGHDKKKELLEELLHLMAREKKSPEVQQAFADCALDVKAAYAETDHRLPPSWSSKSICNIILILLAADRTQQAWEMFELFKLHNLVPSESLMKQFFDSIKASNNAEKAVKLVQISASFFLPVTSSLQERVQQEFELTEEQKNILSDLESSMHND
ncbi:small ribosomal subunit protein mS39 [Salminus brasiliensis]|uniref:small ribosomal subunit protein mS39 n=1 Tax=Salminus brasiliensis TaxID=930266 RepID=UPI003B83A46D